MSAVSKIQVEVPFDVFVKAAEARKQVDGFDWYAEDGGEYSDLKAFMQLPDQAGKTDLCGFVCVAYNHGDNRMFVTIEANCDVDGQNCNHVFTDADKTWLQAMIKPAVSDFVKAVSESGVVPVESDEFVVPLPSGNRERWVIC